jgi:signal transduction histidine kinase
MDYSVNIQPKSSSILIVDDNPHNLQVLGSILKENNYGIEFATDGKAALDWLAERRFDLILLDINMPGMDGFEVCKKIRSDKNMEYVPVIFLSAETERASILKGFEIGGQDYVTKPFDSRELLVRIRTHLALRESLERLEVEKERAQSADHLKSAFLATMSHELRTPLNSIIGFTGILLKEKPGPLTAEQKKQMEMVQGSARHLLSLINDVLDISKIEAGQLKMVIQQFNLRELLLKVVESQRQFAEKKNLQIIVNLDDKINGIESDILRVEQILINLVNNAIKFTETGSVSIMSQMEGDFITIRISDTGIGIESDKIGRLFSPFTQIDSGLTRKYEGTGLGLSICRKLIELLGGKIEVMSKPGYGSTFTVYLPKTNE